MRESGNDGEGFMVARIDLWRVERQFTAIQLADFAAVVVLGLAAGGVDDGTEQVVGVPCEVSTGGDHRNDRFGEARIKAGEGVAEIPVPAAP